MSKTKKNHLCCVDLENLDGVISFERFNILHHKRFHLVILFYTAHISRVCNFCVAVH